MRRDSSRKDGHVSHEQDPSTNPWQSMDYRDENARLLVRAIHRHADALLERFPRVPVQGYVIWDSDEFISGALPVGALVTLWNRLPEMHGDCELCRTRKSLHGFAFNVADDGWRIVAPCVQCASYAWRGFTIEAFFELLAEGLDGSPFRVPSPSELQGMLAHPHTALIAALRALGVKLLPPEHFGFVGYSFDWLSQVVNPVRLQAITHVLRANVRHAKTGARVELTQPLRWSAIQVVERELDRTCALPELDHDLGDGIRITFPLASQEEIAPASGNEGRELPVEEDLGLLFSDDDEGDD